MPDDALITLDVYPIIFIYTYNVNQTILFQFTLWTSHWKHFAEKKATNYIRIIICQWVPLGVPIISTQTISSRALQL